MSVWAHEYMGVWGYECMNGVLQDGAGVPRLVLLSVADQLHCAMCAKTPGQLPVLSGQTSRSGRVLHLHQHHQQGQKICKARHKSV